MSDELARLRAELEEIEQALADPDALPAAQRDIILAALRTQRDTLRARIIEIGGSEAVAVGEQAAAAGAGGVAVAGDVLGDVVLTIPRSGLGMAQAEPTGLAKLPASIKEKFISFVMQPLTTGQQLAIGFLGLSLLLVGIGVLVYANVSPVQRLRYLGSGVLVESYLILPSKTPSPGSPTPMPTPPYRAEVDINGPDTLRFGTSARIELEAKVISNTLPFGREPAIPLATSGNYSATARIQPGNFDIAEEVAGIRETQMLSLQSPARWAWVISPQEKRLGSQEVVFDVFIYDQNGNRIGAPFSSAKVYVKDPVGLPSGVVYLGTAIGGIMSVPLWTWIYNEWSTRQKEKREKRKKVAKKPTKRRKRRRK